MAIIDIFFTLNIVAVFKNIRKHQEWFMYPRKGSEPAKSESQLQRGKATSKVDEEVTPCIPIWLRVRHKGATSKNRTRATILQPRGFTGVPFLSV